MKQNKLRAPGNRVILSESVPLSKPFCIRIEPAKVCNFKCEFCIHSKESFRKSYKCGIMDYNFFESIVQDIKKSFGKVKNIMLVAMGEPLINPRIADMVKLIQDENIADTVEITTNASLLTKEMSDALCDAGLSLLRISVNGLSSEDYKNRCGIDLDFDEFVSNVRYMYNKKSNTKIYTKIINYMVKQDEDYKKFIYIFEPISDIVNVENLIPTIPNEINYNKFAGNDIDFNETQSNTKLLDSNICTMPFYTLQINFDGKIYPCCEVNAPSIGDVTDMSLKEIWNTHSFNFQRNMLEGLSNIDICSNCIAAKYTTYPEDRLDDNVEDIKKRYDQKK